MSATVREPWTPKTSLDRAKVALIAAVFYAGVTVVLRWVHHWIGPSDPGVSSGSPTASAIVAAAFGATAGWIGTYATQEARFKWRCFGMTNFTLLTQLYKVRADHLLFDIGGAFFASLFTGAFLAALWTWAERMIAPAVSARPKPPSKTE